MSKILIADDEIKIRQTLADYFTAKGESCKTAANGMEAAELCERERFDLVILDVMMPLMSGTEAARRIRRRSDLPILFLSALGEEEDYIKGFASGADDYIVKPFPLAVLYEKCKAMIKRYKNNLLSEKIDAGGLSLDKAIRKLSYCGKDIELSQTDYKIMLILMENKNQVISREKLLISIWGYDYEGSTRTIDTHIKRIRKALGKDGARLIKTAVGIGYYIEDK